MAKKWNPGMVSDHGAAVLVVDSRPRSRGEMLFLAVSSGLLIPGLFAVAVWACIAEWPRSPAAAVTAAVYGAIFAVVVWPSAILSDFRDSPRGTWRLDGDGISFTPRRGPTVALRWKAIERVRWR